MSEFTKTVRDASEYNHLARHAKEIGFEPTEFYFHGAWQTSVTENEEPVFVRGARIEVKKVGRTLFHAVIDGSVTGIKPDPSSPSNERGTVTVTFADD